VEEILPIATHSSVAWSVCLSVICHACAPCFNLLMDLAGTPARFNYFGDSALTVVDVLLECHHYNVVRPRYFSVTILKELFDVIDTHNIFAFIKAIDFYNRI